ncbi:MULTISPECIES: hypothetical protein [Azohydromonas]|jgi:hypothetical protein|uniref:Uncharacterized protein n=1 Tax=Azohydromonas lata TaxID=45677 RepID=A0ABU5IA16_9BURK|nr:MULTISPECIES: hypothetical protein [Azohydromonas]MDZ5455694.1 hypothetical protein [Azohydromonas lata]
MYAPRIHKSAAVLVAALALLAVPAAQAGDGHDHGDAPPAATGPALPRFAAVSEDFELVAVVNGTHLTLYLDHADSNSPVKDAQLEVEIGGQKIKVQPHAEGEFEATLAQPLQPGATPVTATVTAGAVTDLLAGELDLHADEHAEQGNASHWQSASGWVAGVLGALGAMAWGWRRYATGRRSRTGAAA